MTLIAILVADAGHARLFTAENATADLHERESFIHPEGRLHDRQLTTDLPGKIKSPDGSGHAFEQPTDPKQHESEKFAHYLGQYLQTAHSNQEFKYLILIAEPRFLGYLRQQMPEQLKKHISFELDKDLTMQTPPHIRDHLPTHLPTHLSFLDE